MEVVAMQCYIQKITMSDPDRREVRNPQGEVAAVSYGTPVLQVEATLAGGFGIVEGVGPLTRELLGQRVSVGGHSGVVVNSTYSMGQDSFPTVEVEVRLDGGGGQPLEAWWQGIGTNNAVVVTGGRLRNAPPSPPEPEPVVPRVRTSRVLPAHLRGGNTPVDSSTSRTPRRKINMTKRGRGV